MSWDESQNCFGCSKDNQYGLRLEFRFDGGRLFSSYIARQEHEGYAGILHGGITASVLDEIMGALLQEKELYCVTAELTVKYILPVQTGDQLDCFAEVISIDGRRVRMRAVAKMMDGTIVATAESLFIKIKDNKED